MTHAPIPEQHSDLRTERRGEAPRRRARGALLVLLLLLGHLGIGIAVPAVATAQETGNATPANDDDTQHWWNSDGCSVVPDSGVHGARVTAGTPPLTVSTYVVGTYDFHHACVHHDGCYRHHWADKGTCDRWFLNDMNASCQAIGGNGACYDRARLYYWGVVVFGGGAYGQRSAAIPMDAYVA
ncbi:hypothetical protein ACI79C_06620 [Geodermatophilus sp. SYSU D00697]